MWDMWDIGTLGHWDKQKDYRCCPVNNGDWCDFAKVLSRRSCRQRASRTIDPIDSQRAKM
ncbi:MAG: hypothetical protein EBZ36_03525 [Acidobacteria bacterium]|nr:hypothetical protein [Acidobacteriota bacterium]